MFASSDVICQFVARRTVPETNRIQTSQSDKQSKGLVPKHRSLSSNKRLLISRPGKTQEQSFCRKGRFTHMYIGLGTLVAILVVLGIIFLVRRA